MKCLGGLGSSTNICIMQLIECMTITCEVQESSCKRSYAYLWPARSGTCGAAVSVYQVHTCNDLSQQLLQFLQLARIFKGPHVWTGDLQMPEEPMGLHSNHTHEN